MADFVDLRETLSTDTLQIQTVLAVTIHYFIGNSVAERPLGLPARRLAHWRGTTLQVLRTSGYHFRLIHLHYCQFLSSTQGCGYAEVGWADQDVKRVMARLRRKLPSHPPQPELVLSTRLS